MCWCFVVAETDHARRQLTDTESERHVVGTATVTPRLARVADTESTNYGTRVKAGAFATAGRAQVDR